MAKGRLTGSFSHLLYMVGDAIHFAPASSFAPPCTEKEVQERPKPFFSARLKIKNALARTCEQSFFLNLYSSVLRVMFNTRVRAFGVMLFSCGFLQILSYFLGVYLPFAAGDENNLVFGVTLVFLSLLCSFTRGDLKDVIKKSFFYRGVLGPLFGSDGWEFPAGRSGDRFFSMILLGAAIALPSILFSPFSVFLNILAFFGILFVFYQPEAGLIFVALTLFSAPFRITAMLTLLTLAAFFCKCAVGKRTVVYSLYDGIVILFLLPLLFFSQSRALFLVLVALYFLALGLMRTLASTRRFLGALTLGGVFCSVMILARYILESFFAELLFRFPNLDRFLFLDAEEAVLAPVAMIGPVAMGLLRSKKKSARFLLVPLTLLTTLGAVFCGRSLSLWICLIFAFAVQNMMTYRLAAAWYVAAALTLIIGINVTPIPWLRKILTVFGFGGAAQAAESTVFSVMGVGTILGGVILAGLLGWFVFITARFSAGATRPEAFPRVLGAVGAMVAFAAMALYGVAANENVLVLFVLLLALPGVSLICAKREEIRLPY